MKSLGRVGIVILCAALLLRLLLLGIKPPHFDEGVNGWFADQITRQGYFFYDPTNYHGPLHFYVLFVFQTLLGRSIWALRLPVVIVGMLTVYLLLRFDRFIDRRICRLAAAAFALSPAAVFYNRYAIHETWLALFLILPLWGAAGLVHHGTRQYLWAVGIGIAGMILTKETYVIHLACFVLAAGVLKLLEIFRPSASVRIAQQQWSRSDLLTVIGVNIGVTIFFYSGTFFAWPALAGVYQTFATWFETGKQGHGHEKPFFYWLELMLRYEWPALIGVVVSMRYLWLRTDPLLRFIAIYGVGTLLAYSLIPYKTPWIALVLLWPFFFTFAHAVVDLADLVGRRFATGVAAAFLAISAVMTVRLNYFRYDNESEPYVYVQTFRELGKFTGPLFELVAGDPTGYHIKGHIVLSSYHPLPWMLGDFANIGYYGTNQVPQPADADFIAIDASRVDQLEPLLSGNYFTEAFKVRGSQEPAKAYFGAERFAEIFPGRSASFAGKQPAGQ